MSTSELSERNYKRICFINWMMSVPLLLIFSWPYYFFCHELGINRVAMFAGSITFALPFMFTILHGHVTMALGAVHRHHYYSWLQGFPFTYGLLFHPIIISTRFRLILFSSSLVILVVGYLLA
ncbi:hypothetical protein [Rhodohalobacter mucosus]|uniref:hypothetical protein n=1 Tax=Rhodohalobacter mucosus TaxID=2079485 RepID=UPI001FA81C7D|nr:hypothetical protein [Rhodohalobacter mucosus]